MDPFAQRMLERAKLRRERLLETMHSSPNSKSPLKEKQNLPEETKVDDKQLKSAMKPKEVHFAENPKKSPKEEFFTRVEPDELKPSPTKTNNINSTKTYFCKTGHENSSISSKTSPPKTYFTSTGHGEKPTISNFSRDKLKRLGALYSDENSPNIPSPIHRSEDKFVDQEPKGVKCKLRSNKLAALASTINQWEDDLSHPSLCAPKTDGTESVKKEEFALKKKNLGQMSQRERDPTSGNKKVINEDLLDILEAQGFSRSKCDTKMTFDFKKTENSSVRNSFKSPKKSFHNSPTKSPRMGTNMIKKPEEIKPLMVRNISNSNLDTKVMRKAAMFEAVISPPAKTYKDPTELSLAERKALFEKNKSQALVPKVAFGTPLPAKLVNDKKDGKVEPRQEKWRCDQQAKEEVQTNKIMVHKEMFERGLAENNVNSAIQERQKELEFLKSRWNKNKEIAVAPKTTGTQNTHQPQVVRAITQEIPPPPPLPTTPNTSVLASVTSPPTLYKDSPETTKVIKDVKKIVVSPPTGGRMYPSIMEVSAESESDSDTANTSTTSNKLSNKDLYLNMSFSDILEANRHTSLTPSKSNNTFTEDDIGDLMDDALGDVSDDDDVSPPKQAKLSPAVLSNSFKYENNMADTPLMHSVSFYRKQQSQVSTPVRTVTREPEPLEIDFSSADESLLVQQKIQQLTQEVSKQQVIISQASQALNLCLATVEFSNSEEQVEGERLLLLATQKRQACLHEIQRLKVENTLQPNGAKSGLNESGNVTVTDICLPLKREALHNMAVDESMHYFLCLVRCDDKVIATPSVSATRDHMKETLLKFPGQVTLKGLYSNFTVTVEVYNLKLNKEMLPHIVKYHIKESGKKKRTPLKLKKGLENKLLMPSIQSPAGPSSVRTSSFQLVGFFVFSLREITRREWILNKVPYTSPLEGSIQMKIESELKLDSEYRGFLTMFEDISGFGAWHRRWCLLSAYNLSYWRYPDDEKEKVPLGSIDLRNVITNHVGIISREICARPHTFSLEITRPSRPEDQTSLVLIVKGNTTIVRHLLSADTKEDRIDWCNKLNKALALIRAWSGKK